MFVTSIIVIVMAAVINVTIVPSVLLVTAVAGRLTGGDPALSGRGPGAAFSGMLAFLSCWALICFVVADWLAGEEFGQRWVLLFCAAALAGAPYLLYQRRVSALGISARLVEPLHSAMAYSGGIQSKIVVAAMLSGIYFDWWQHLPG